MCGTEMLPPMRLEFNPRTAKQMKAEGFWNDMLHVVSPDLPGHPPADGDRRYPRMGGKPNKGTKKDKRLKKNKK